MSGNRWSWLCFWRRKPKAYRLSACCGARIVVARSAFISLVYCKRCGQGVSL